MPIAAFLSVAAGAILFVFTDILGIGDIALAEAKHRPFELVSSKTVLTPDGRTQVLEPVFRFEMEIVIGNTYRKTGALLGNCRVSNALSPNRFERSDLEFLPVPGQTDTLGPGEVRRMRLRSENVVWSGDEFLLDEEICLAAGGRNVSCRIFLSGRTMTAEAPAEIIHPSPAGCLLRQR